MAKTQTFVPPTPVIGYTAGTIGKRSSAPSSASGKPANTMKRTAPQGATQLPNKPMQPLRPSRTVDPETEARELAEARILLCQRRILAQVGGVAEDQIHRLIDKGL